MRLSVERTPSLDLSAHDLVVLAARSKDLAPLALELGLDAEVAHALAAEAQRIGFDAKVGSNVSVIAPGGMWVVATGAGNCAHAGDWRRVASHAVSRARELKAKKPAFAGARTADELRFATEGAILTGYAFDAYFSESPTFPVATLTLLATDAFDAAITRGIHVAEATCVARDVANEHPGKCTPAWLAKRCRKIAEEHDFELSIRDEEELEKEGFRLILAVGKGSKNPPRLVHMIYRPRGPVKKRLAFVGKGITYDSGGYSMKPSEFQINMHLDMGGSAAVIGAAEAIGRIRPEGVEVHFIVPAAENLVSHKAYKVMEIVRSYSGRTVQIKNTDAEGRLVLADALTYAQEQKPDVIVDLATLTGACVVALGNETAGLFSNQDDLARGVLDAARAASERMWHMPLVDALNDSLRSDVADMQNIGAGRVGGAISAACFLGRFIEEGQAWAHIDLAGPAMLDKGSEYICAGGTGFGVATLVALVEMHAAS